MDSKLTLAGIVIALVGWLLYERNKRRSAEALNDNQESKEKVTEIQKEIVKNEARNEVEEEKRESLKETLDKAKNEEVSTDNILDFFNRKSDK